MRPVYVAGLRWPLAARADLQLAVIGRCYHEAEDDDSDFRDDDADYRLHARGASMRPGRRRRGHVRRLRVTGADDEAAPPI